MKNVHRTLALLLIAVLAAGLLCGCQKAEEKMEMLSGTWFMVIPGAQEQVSVLLEPLELYPEELALLDLAAPSQVRYVCFEADGSYRFGYDAGKTVAKVRDFYEEVFETLYDNRSSLEEAYRLELEGMTREEFNQFLADVYNADDFGALLNRLVEQGCNAAALQKPLEQGTYTISFSSVVLTAAGQTESRSLHYLLDSSSLTLTEGDVQNVYMK